jgi:hypothetical protein
MDAVKAAYRAVTRQIEVRVMPRFLPDRLCVPKNQTLQYW